MRLVTSSASDSTIGKLSELGELAELAAIGGLLAGKSTEGTTSVEDRTPAHPKGFGREQCE